MCARCRLRRSLNSLDQETQQGVSLSPNNWVCLYEFMRESMNEYYICICMSACVLHSCKQCVKQTSSNSCLPRIMDRCCSDYGSQTLQTSIVVLRSWLIPWLSGAPPPTRLGVRLEQRDRRFGIYKYINPTMFQVPHASRFLGLTDNVSVGLRSGYIENRVWVSMRILVVIWCYPRQDVRVLSN